MHSNILMSAVFFLICIIYMVQCYPSVNQDDDIAIDDQDIRSNVRRTLHNTYGAQVKNLNLRGTLNELSFIV